MIASKSCYKHIQQTSQWSAAASCHVMTEDGGVARASFFPLVRRSRPLQPSLSRLSPCTQPLFSNTHTHTHTITTCSLSVWTGLRLRQKGNDTEQLQNLSFKRSHSMQKATLITFSNDILCLYSVSVLSGTNIHP